MPTVVQVGNVSIGVHAEGGERHHYPHCHIASPNYSASVRIPGPEFLRGNPLPPRIRRILEENMEAIVAAWNALNPQRPA